MTTIQSRKSSGRSPGRGGLVLIGFLLTLIALPSFAVKPSPVGVTITQATGNLSNHKLIITGTNFSMPVVNLDNVNLTVTSSTSTTITATLPAMITEGSYHLRVTTSTGIANLDLALENGDLGNGNTYEGAAALASFTTGSRNTAVGANALFANAGGDFNDAVGALALAQNVDGISNNAFGDSALFANIHGSLNTALGDLALTNNDSTGANMANFNTAVGANALQSNTDGNSNNAVGVTALGSNTVGIFNEAMGFQALGANVDGSSNVGVGDSAMNSNVSGSFNTMIGDQAGADLTSGGDNIYIGATAGSGVTTEDGTIRIGDPNFVGTCFIAGINTSAVAGNAVFVDANGQLGLAPSSQRFKDEIKPMDKASEAILSLKPVTFRYKHELDPKGAPQFGLVAEEVEKVNPDLVVRDAQGKTFTVRYEAINAMLLNEFLKAHRRVEELEATVAQLKATAARQQKDFTARLNEQDAKIQKVSDRVELSKTAPQVVGNNQ